MFESFSIKNEVPKFELCKRLKELGFWQGYDTDAGFYWVKIDGKWKLIWDDGGLEALDSYYTENAEDWVKAPTIMEMLNLLPFFISEDTTYLLTISKGNRQWFVGYCMAKFDLVKFMSEHLPNTLAELMIWAIEKDYVKLKIM